MKTINSLRSKFFALTLAIVASVSSFAYEFEYVNDFHIDGFAYKIISRTNPCSVALIEVADCEKHVALPESVTYNDSTFIVTTLGMGNIVFSGTARNTMESIYIPKTIMIVNYRALGDCPNLKSIVVDEENKYLDSRNNCNAIISSNDTYRPANQLVVGCKTTVIPNSVTEIGNYAFVRCETLENITIPEGVTRICDGAFYECTSLSSIKLPESITQLPQQWIFSGCTNLKEVFFFAKTPPYIAYGMFQGLNPTIYVPTESLKAYIDKLYWQDFDIQAIPDSMYFDDNHFVKDSIHYHILNDTIAPFEVEVTYTWGAASNFTQKNYNELTEANIPATVEYKGKVYNVTRIGEFAFNFATKLQRVTMSDNIKVIDRFAIINCSQLTEVQIGEQVDSILLDAFSYGRLETISIPKNVKYIAPLIVRNNPITSIKVHPENANYTSVDGVLFNKQENLLHSFPAAKATEYVIPETVDTVGGCAFANVAITSVTFPDNLVYIAQNAFINTKLSKLNFPASITAIEMNAFDLCIGITEVTCRATTPPRMSDGQEEYMTSVFCRVPLADATLYVPAESVEAYKSANQWKDFGQILPIEPTSYKSQWCDTWNVMWFDGMRFDETASTSQYRLGKDTVIGDYTYSKFTSRTSVRFTDDRKVYVYYEGFDDHDPYTEDLPTGEYLAYDFSAQVGDTLEIFSGVGTYSTYSCVVYDVETAPSPCVVDDEQADLKTLPLIIKLRPLCDVDGEGNMEISSEEITWVEGVGSPEGFLISSLPCGWVGGGTYALLCAYKGDELKYTGSLYERFGCDYKAGVVSDDLFPTLSGLQRTICREYCEQADNKTRIEQFTNLTTRTETGGPYLYYSPFLLREKDNKILIYSRTLNKDLVLYDFNLQVGDSLPMLYIDFFAKDDWIADRDMEIWCVVDYHKDLEGNILPADTLIVTDVSAITLLDGKEYKKWTFNNGMEYVEGIGSFGNRQWSGDFFQLIVNRDVPTSLQGEHLICASKNGQLLYKMDDTEMEQLETECLCEYNAEQKPEDLFPTLWGLQRTSCDEWYDGCGENKSYLFAPKEVKEINGKLYLKCGGVFLREEDNKVLIYSFPYEKDLVLYDWTLEIGDTLQNLGIDPYSFPELEYAAVVDYIAYEDYDVETGDFIIKKEPLGNKRVKDISTIRLLDGNEYKAWLFGYDWERGDYYIEGIGNANKYGGDYVDLAHPFAVPTCYYGERLVCVSRDGVLLYQIDDAEMERLGTECLCDYNSGPKKDNAKNGKIGGRPTPTQWNMLEVETKEMDGTPTILRAETFSYTLENDSIIANNKTFYQLARQSTKDTAITKSFVGALHFGEDEDNRVYFLRDEVEYVLYDFTAEIGDTVEIFAGINNYPQETTYTHVVTGKDTLENGACRMMLEVVFPDETTTATNAEKVWLAGLGSIDGIVHNAAQRTSDTHAAPAKSASSETQTSVMLCAWREDSCLYTTNHPEYDTFGCVYNQDPTAIENLTSPSSYQKIIHEGTLLILHEGKVYNAIGIQIK